MPKEAPFDVWDGEELGLTDEVEDGPAEETAMHLDPESDAEAEGGPHWSDLTDGDDAADPDAPVCCYFADEHPEAATAPRPRTNGSSEEEREIDLNEILTRQHYM